MTDGENGTIVTCADRPRESWDEPTRGDASWFTFFSSELTRTDSMSAGVMEIAPNGGCLKAHKHAQAEIYFVFQGEGVLAIEGVSRTVRAGAAAFIPGDAEHTIRNDTKIVLKIFYVFPADSFGEVVYRF